MDRLKRIQLGGVEEDGEERIRQIIDGVKTAMVCPASEYPLPEGEYDDGGWEVNDLVEVFNRDGRIRCRIKVTEVYPVRFGDVPEKLWLAENCSDLAHFQEVHVKWWSYLNLTDEFMLMALHFELVEVVEARGSGN
ncbi:MAG: ASCH domain-containing protein [bacterium]|nr:ASCH domain-containing protein [bacterium]